MSTTGKGVLGEPGSPHSSSSQPGALALLGATALGGVIGSRLRGAPLMIAAGATAFALLRKKPASPALAPARPPQEIQPQNLVEQWLEQQTEREQQAPLIPLHAASAPEDDYTPEPLLAAPLAEAEAPTLRQDHFASLTEPVARAIPAVRRIEPATPVASGWIPGIDPLPSWSETPDNPVQGTDPSPAPENTPTDTAPVFAGGTLPDEIEVTQPPESLPAQRRVFEQPDETPPQVLTAPEADPPSETEISPEIPVHLAEPGEASFDPPLMSSSWPGVEASQPAQAASVVVEAEIILRPRAPTHNTVTSKNMTAPPAFSPATPAEAEPAGQDSPALPRAPLQTPREQRARGTWRSWWRGD
ncbi:MAG TPA: hypothetical protein DDZ88_10510 [Verrucomicrobiales bacterium]|nr:hypothetical protein [Verrucomicrobiales bacterium]